MSKLLGIPLGYIMWLLYKVTNSYGFALLLFTVLVRLLLFPLSLNQQKSSVKMMMIQPQLKAIQDKYKNNKEKLNEEMMNLYSKEGYNPASGCLPMLIQLPILYGLIDVIYRPLTHILHLSKETILKGTELVGALYDNVPGNHVELFIIRAVREAADKFSAMGAEAVAEIQSLQLNFLGIDLTQVPSTKMFGEIFTNFNPVLLIPLLSGVSALAVSLVSMRNSTADMSGSTGNSMKGMMLTMPIISTIFTFSVPAGVGLYWFYSNLAAMAQTLILNKFYNPKEIAAKAQAEYEQRKEQERQERIQAKKEAKAGKAVDDQKALSQKELNRKKLAEARRRDAEKYGEEYVEVTDDDLN